MSKVTGPLFSLGASKTLRDTLTFQRRPSGHAVYLKTQPGKVTPFTPSAGQIAQRAVIATRVSDWQALSASDKANWDALAIAAGYIGTGYHYYIHKGLPPAPPPPNNVYSLLLDKNSHQYATISDAAQTGLDFSTTFTIEAWIKIGSLTGQDAGGICGKEDTSSGDTRSYGFYIDNWAVPKGTLRCVICNSGTYDYYYYATPISTGIWVHVAVTCNTAHPSATTFEFFINGHSVGNGTAASAGNISTIKDTAAPVMVGSRYSGGNIIEHFDGLLDEIRMWSDVRTAQEILDNYNIKSIGNEQGLVACYRMENNYLDLTANNNDLTPSGNPVFSTDIPFT